MSIFDKYKKYRIAYRNVIFVMWNAYRKRELTQVILKDHSKRVWPTEWASDYANTMKLFPEKDVALKQLQLYDSIQMPDHPNKDEFGEFIEFEYKNHQCRFYGVTEAGRIVNGDIVSVFIKEEYGFLNPEKSIVIDIGANIGDTGIYFCLNDAERVIALEPFPFSYKYATINVTTNKMKDKIEVLNAGYGKDSELKINDKKSTIIDILEISDDGQKINTYSIVTLLNMYGLNDKDNLLLKMDCEGCEYNLLKEPVDVLRKFKRIEVEFHYGYKNLESKLEEAGFSVHHSKPLESHGSEPSLRKMALINKDFTFGMIYAERHLV